MMEEMFKYQMKEEDDFYTLLGCDELSSTEQINTEFKLKARNVHPDKNPGDPSSTQRFAVLQLARDVLVDDQRRKEYDLWRRSGIAVPYDSWTAMRDRVHVSLHWTVRKKDLMLEEPSNVEVDSSRHRHPTAPTSNNGQFRPSIPTGWSREPADDILQKFRNYNI